MGIRWVSEKVGMTGSGGEDQARMNDSQPTPCPMPEAFISPPDLLAVTQHYKAGGWKEGIKKRL
ncbi:MAG TPA: hypothetical protein VGK10_13730 [Prolixibacteraceae bacterium]|jgi:hypothetical protein